VLPMKWQLKEANGTTVTSARPWWRSWLWPAAAARGGPAPALPPKPYTTVPGQVAVFTRRAEAPRAAAISAPAPRTPSTGTRRRTPPRDAGRSLARRRARVFDQGPAK
jgi:hypothetical protein